MEQIIKRAGVDHLDLIQRGKVTINSANLSQGMLTDDTVKFSISSNSELDIKINDTVDVLGNTYRINSLPTFKKISNSSYAYEIEAQGLMYDLLRCKFFNADATGFKTTTNFPLIGNLEVFLTAIKNNMSRFSVLWEIGNFAETETKMMTFGDDTCLSALQKICQEFKTDFWVKSEGGKHKIHTGQFGSTLPIEFEYGKGKGLYSLSRSNVDNNGIVNRLYVNGGSQNIPAGYRSFSDNLKFSDAGYLEDTALIAEIGLKEGTLDLPEIYPKRTGKITALGSTKFKFTDSTMDFDLNAKNTDNSTKYLIAGTTAKVHFNTGNLAGYEFEIKKGGYNTATKEFEIIPFKNETGQKFPDEAAAAFQFSINDEYVLLDIVMPNVYITNAEIELLAKGTEQFNLNKVAKVSYDLEVDPEYLKTLATPISIGDYVRVKDSALGIDKVIRVQQITRNFITANAPTPYNYKITLADSYEINYASQMILDIKDIKNVVNITNLGSINLSQLGYKTTEELRNLVFDTDGYFDAGNIKPFSIQTNMLTVGAQSQQLSCSVVFSVNDGGIVNKVDSKAGVLFSQTFNKSWNIAALNTTIPDNNFRYVYAKCSKVGSSGTIFYTQSQIKFDEDPNDYYFLLGILHTVTEGVRVLSITIGTTTINGGLIRTGVISSLDGLTTFNLDTGEFKGKFTFSNGTNVQTAVENAQNTANGAVKTVDVEYYLSNSPTVLSGGDWVTIAPTWVNGKYMWSRTKTTLVNGNTTYTPSANGVCIAGAEGTSGAPGKGITSITENYYLSTSKTMQISGEWTNTPPTWIPNTYLWTRSTIVWNNPTSTTTTPPIVDSSWEAINGMQIGGRNLIAKTNLELGGRDDNGGLISTVEIIRTIKPIAVEELGKYTLATYNKGIGHWRYDILFIHWTGYVMSKLTVEKDAFFEIPNGCTTINLNWYDDYKPLDLNWVLENIKNKLEKGNKATDWTPAPEDIDSAIAGANTNAANAAAQATNALNTANKAAAVTNFMQTTVDGNVVSTGTLQVGSVTGANAGITGVVDDADPVRIWAGALYANRKTAPWRIHESGFQRGNHQSGNKPLAFEWGVNADGTPVIDFYHVTGFKTFTLDPNRGLIAVNYTPESWTYIWLLSIGQSSATLNSATAETFLKTKITEDYFYENPGIIGEVQVKSFFMSRDAATLYYDYQNGTHPNNIQYAPIVGYKTTNGNRNANIPNGWYAMSFEYLGSYRQPPNLSVSVQYALYYILDGKVTKTQMVTLTLN